MLVLALDTATSVPALALAGDGFESEARLPAGRHASEALLPALAGLLERAGHRLDDVGRIVACAGPGSFTGIRVGLATAWGFSRALGIPLETIGSLEAIAETARGFSETRVTACLDAERGDVYVGGFDLEGLRARELFSPRLVAAGSPRPEGGPVVPLASGGITPALAAARAARRSPGAACDVPRAVYVRPSAAEERHGFSGA